MVSVWKVLLVVATSGLAGAQVSLNPASMAKVGTVSPRFQSYNVEMVEVTGGRFWAPYTAKTAAAEPASAAASAPAGMDPSLYRYRAPIDLGNARLRMLARALGPAYIRVSGTWANYTYFQDSDAAAPASPPEGFGNTLTRAQWRGVIDFAKATDAKIVSSFAISAGVRDAAGVWTPVEAKPWLAFTKAAGGEIAAAEMFNEPTFAAIGGAPKGYDDAAYGRDFKAFRAFVKEAAPGMTVLGPGSIGEAGALGNIPGMTVLGPGSIGEAGALGNIPGNTPLDTAGMIAAEGPGLDTFSYHFYGGVSKRCVALGAKAQTTPDAALSEDWLDRTNRDADFYMGLRDKLTPGLPVWLTETAETACGGNPWASTFLDTFRYLNQLGTLAKKGVQVVAHNTLAASDYGLIDEATLTPRPDYWAALLWRQLMGTTVLDAGVSPGDNLYVYAHCQRETPGAVAVLAINADRAATRMLTVPVGSRRYTLTGKELLGGTVALNGVTLALGAGDAMPKIAGEVVRAGKVSLAPASITFLTMAAGNGACR